MKVIIQKNTSSEDIRSALSAFGRFSSIEIDEEKKPDGKENVLIFREVGFFKELRQLIFESKENLEQKRKNNRDYLTNFSKERPEIQKLLGSSILDKGHWTAGELREKLKIKTVLIKYEKNNNLLETPLVSESKVGVIDARISKVKADSVISWKTPNVDNSQDRGIHGVKSENENSRKTISVEHKVNPNDAQIRAAYQSALSKATGQVVISPIVDLPVDQIQKSHPENAKSSGIQDEYSDDSIRILLEEIDNAVRDNKNIRSVTIARGGGPDEKFLPRFVGQRAILDEKKRRDVENQSTNLPPMPDSLKLVKRELADRFLLNKADELQNVTFHATRLERVKTCQAKPEMLTADVAFLDVLSIARGAVELKKSGMGELARVWSLSFDKRFTSSQEVAGILDNTKTTWKIGAFELPACELPATQVIALERDMVPATGCAHEKDFFMTHLKNLKGRVVIEVGEPSSMREGLMQALEELSKRPGGLGFDCVLASKHDYALSIFKKNLSEEEALKSSINQPKVESNTTIEKAVTPASDRGKFKPKGNKLAPRSGGVHFMNNPPLDLIADRTIVPKSIASASGNEALSAEDIKEIGKLDTGRLISVPDELTQSPQSLKLDQIKPTFLGILAKCSGSVVISPPYDQVDALTELCSAVYQACEENRLLSVSFAVTDKKIQENLMKAASSILISPIDEREPGIDDGDENDLESLALEWKSA
jgi:hypothetical protein